MMFDLAALSYLCSLQEILYLSLELRRVYSGVAHQARFNQREPVPQPINADVAAAQEAGHILEVLCMAAFQFGKRLQREIVMKELHLSYGFDVPAAFPPVRSPRYEIIRGRQLHIDIEAIFEHRDRFEGAPRLRVQLEVYVNRLLSKAQQQRRGAAGEVHFAWASRRRCKLLHELFEGFDGIL